RMYSWICPIPNGIHNNYSDWPLVIYLDLCDSIEVISDITGDRFVFASGLGLSSLHSTDSFYWRGTSLVELNVSFMKYNT
ncbi:3194_t:CDS:1, partial [Acaulospora morrowiae]